MKSVRCRGPSARFGLPNFTGIDSPYEPPDDPDIRINGTNLSPEEAATQIFTTISSRENDEFYTSVS